LIHACTNAKTANKWVTHISNNPSFRLKHPGVPDGSDGCGGTSYPLMENQTRPVAQATGCVAYLPCGGYYTMPLMLATRRICILRSPLRRQASFTLRPESGDVYAPSERHVCYTLRRCCSYAVAIYTTPGDVYAFLQPIATCRTLIYV
jgi:hypothetical protein